MKSTICASVLGVAALLLVTGCSPESVNADDGPGGRATQVVSPQFVDIEQVPAGQGGNTGNVEQPAPKTRGSEAALLQRILQDLSARLAVSSSEITMAGIEEEVWADGSLGCPEAGKAYVQGAVKGYRVTMRAQDRDYVYHTRGYEEFLWCDNGTPILP
jgi:hypothetical protein